MLAGIDGVAIVKVSESLRTSSIILKVANSWVIANTLATIQLVSKQRNGHLRVSGLREL